MRIIIQGVATGHPKENARKMSSGCQSTVDQLVACVPKVQPLLHFDVNHNNNYWVDVSFLLKLPFL